MTTQTTRNLRQCNAMQSKDDEHTEQCHTIAKEQHTPEKRNKTTRQKSHIPALLTMTSNLPYLWTANPTAPFTLSSSVTSHLTKPALSTPSALAEGHLALTNSTVGVWRSTPLRAAEMTGACGASDARSAQTTYAPAAA